MISDDLRRALQSLADPRTLLLIALLLVNDHLLRVRWPAWWTGKLGDVAWLGFAPLVLAVPLAVLLPWSWPRRGDWVAGLSLAIVGGLFALANTMPMAHAAVRRSFALVFGWHPGIRLDPTDLLTLPALLLALFIWRAHRRPSRHPVRLRGLLAIALGCVATLANTPAEPCDQEVQDLEPIESAARSDPFVEALTAEFSLAHVQVDDCFVNGEVEVLVSFDVPAHYSSYGISYWTWVEVIYAQAGSTRLDLGQHRPAHVNTPQTLIQEVRRAIQVLEGDARFAELYQKVDFSEMWPSGSVHADNIEFSSSYPVGPDERYRGPSMLFKWDPERSAWLLRGYEVPTAFEWETYPELERAKQLARERLREEGYRKCRLETDDPRFPTHSGAVRRSVADPWSVHVQLDCGERISTVYFDLEG